MNPGLPIRKLLTISVCALLWSSLQLPSYAAFHLWHVKEAFSSADGNVQFIEMFDSNPGENFVGGFSLQSNSDGVIKNFTFPGSIDFGIDTTNRHLLIATSNFASLPGAVTPDFTFDQGGVAGSFFNPNATNITITFTGSGDSMSFAGAALPKDGINSLTDAGAVGFPPGIPNIGPGVNSPTNVNNQSGSVNASPEPAAVLLALAGMLAVFGLRRR